jgi:hypothetical protein
LHENLSQEDQERLQVAWGQRNQTSTDFRVGRDGDHLMVPFECDLCIFRKLQKRSPRTDFPPDQKLMTVIRRINLDAFWSRASSTVKGNRDRVKILLDLLAEVRLKGPYEVVGNFPHHDHCGYEVAITMLLASQKTGKYDSNHTQWDTIRKYCTAYANHVKTTPQENQQVLAFSDDRGQNQRASVDKCFSMWFSRFFVGCRRRMGQDWRPNKGLSTELIIEVLARVSSRVEGATSEEDSWNWLVFGTYMVVTYVLSLRGAEGLLLDLVGLLSYENKGGDNYLIITLLGKIKGEHNDRCHLLPCTHVTTSGINVKQWVSSLIQEHSRYNRRDGPAITDFK